MSSKFNWLVTLAIGLFVSSAYAQHSDVTFDVDAGQLVVEAEPHEHEEEGHEEEGHEEEEHAGPVLTNDGKYLFETDFGDFDGGPYATDDPGFATHEDTGVLTPGELIGFEVVGSLQYWDGFSWTMATDDVVTIEDILGETTTVTSSGATPGASSFIDAADSLGGLHSHVDFSINADADVGAYLIEMLLTGFDSTGTTEVYLPSETFYIAFNNGLTDESYELGVDALAAVPVPAAAWLFGSALLGLVGIGRKRSNS